MAVIGRAVAPGQRLCFAHLADHSSLQDMVAEAREQGETTLLVAGDQRDVWIIPAITQSACFHCFELWRYQDKLLETPVSWSGDDQLGWCRLPEAAQAFVDMAIATYPSQSPESAANARHCDLVSRTVEDHRLLRHPSCRLCAASNKLEVPPPASSTFDESGQSAFERALSLGHLQVILRERIFDVEHGIVRSLTRQSGSRIIPVASVNGYNYSGPGSATWSFGRTGHCNTDWTVACLEAVERLSGLRPVRGRRTVRGSFEELSDSAVDPRLFLLPEPPGPDEDGSVFSPFSPEIRYDWCEGFSVARAGPVHVPLQLAYYGMAKSEIAGGIFVDENSNGCSLGGSILEAAFHGLLELLERDAFLRHYYADAVVPTFPAEAFSDPFIDGLAARIRADGYEIDFLQLPTGTLACAIAARIRHEASTTGPALAFAAGAHLSPTRAARAAACEVASNIASPSSETLAENRQRGLQLLNAPHEVKTMKDHGLQGWPNDAFDMRDFRTRTGSGLNPSSLDIGLSEAFHSLTDSLAGSGIDVIVVDQSHPNLVKSGLHCVKVLAPGLLPMTFGHRRRRLNAKALARLPLDDARVTDPRTVRPHLFQ
ncbi:YcaO-like family protein [Parerythrobacter aestuarii]|uniref:YcaO-like family protein n=1 Tax=Parerythrobacter aestuarii TaxID=3020909 RepID=UPI0024DE6035|nr:YcaO-like family protein [Parerythrobacter aestuarii]